jgi:hypothetical protein
MPPLPFWFLSTCFAQALHLPCEPIRGRRLVALVAVFAQGFLWVLHSLEQLRDQFVPLGKLVSQYLIFSSKRYYFFF